MPETSKLEKLNWELEKSEKKLRKAINDEKVLQYQLKQLTRKERTHRLCTRGGMLESFLQEPERLTDDDVMVLLKLIFHRQDTQELLKKQGTLRFPCAGCRQLPFCELAIWGHLALQAVPSRQVLQNLSIL